MSEQKKEPETFHSALLRSLKQGISSVVGPESANAFDFYLDPQLAKKDIVTYTKAIENIFTVGSKLIEERCAQALFFNLSLQFEPVDNYKLYNYVEDAKVKWLHADRSRRTYGSSVVSSGIPS